MRTALPARYTVVQSAPWHIAFALVLLLAQSAALLHDLGVTEHGSGDPCTACLQLDRLANAPVDSLSPPAYLAAPEQPLAAPAFWKPAVLGADAKARAPPHL